MNGIDSKWNQAYLSISQTTLKITIGPHSGAKTISSNILQPPFFLTNQRIGLIYAEKFP
jgi:hypothetical protein